MRKNLPLLDQDLPPKNCRSPTLCPRKYHMYAPKGQKFILYKHNHVAYQIEGYEK